MTEKTLLEPLIHMPDPELCPTGDWGPVFSRLFKLLGRTGSSADARVGTVVLHGMYDIMGTLEVPSFVKFLGGHPVAWHGGNSTGFRLKKNPKTGKFGGTVGLRWKMPKKQDGSDAIHSLFGAGMEEVFVECLPGIGGIDYAGAQQCSGLTRVIVRGFGRAVGILFGGDTYPIQFCYADPRLTGGKTVAGAVGFKSKGQPVQVNGLGNTAHNCGRAALEFGNMMSCRWRDMETETSHPVILTYHAAGCALENFTFRHNETLVKVEKARWGVDRYDMHFEGVSMSRKVVLPRGELEWGKPIGGGWNRIDDGLTDVVEVGN